MDKTRPIGSAIAVLGGGLLLAAWGYSGFRMSAVDIDQMMPMSSSPSLYGCYRNGDLVIMLGKSGMSIPGSGVSFSRTALADDKQGKFVAFEPAIDIRRGRDGQLRAVEDPRSQMISKLFIRHQEGSRQLVAPSDTPAGTIFRRDQC